MRIASLWIEAMRLRTLPLSLAGALVASGAAAAAGNFRPEVFALFILTVLSLQILSNFADEYGDLKNGADTDARIGPVRAMQRGEISFSQMKRALILVSAITLVLGIALIIVALEMNPFLLAIFLAMGGFVIFAAIGYTVGKRAYGYLGLGDIFCLICFGWMSVCGGYFLYTHTLNIWVWLAATGIGLPVVGVLNLNNMRDQNTDASTGKKTLVVRIGASNAKIYHTLLLSVGLLLLYIALAGLLYKSELFWLRLLLISAGSIPLLLSLKQTLSVRELTGYDRCMRPLSMSIVLLSLVFAAVAVI
jgi:1,4-dihydroxy-2-naphthoate octaprenyltransferase